MNVKVYKDLSVEISSLNKINSNTMAYQWDDRIRKFGVKCSDVSSGICTTVLRPECRRNTSYKYIIPYLSEMDWITTMTTYIHLDLSMLRKYDPSRDLLSTYRGSYQITGRV